MEKKNLKQEDVKRELYTNAGCNLVAIPVTLIVVGVLAVIGLLMFQYYFFGLEAAFIEPYQDRNYLYLLIGVIIAILLVLTTTWRNFTLFYRSVVRYRTMQQEKSRIERLMQAENTQISDSAENVLYSEESDTLNQSKR